MIAKTKPKRDPRCVACGRRAAFALEHVLTGHLTPVCRFHQRLASAGSASPGYEFVTISASEKPRPENPPG